MDTATLERSPADAARWHYNQASCLAALIGEDEEALVLLRRSLAAGFTSEIIVDDPDLDSLSGNPEFRAMVAEVQGRRGGG